MLDAAVFAAGPGVIDEVWVGGRRVVARGRHVERPRLQAAFSRAMTTLHA
jgi:cytosine/adenosine deaminase-related metal-dependent hydrolase